MPRILANPATIIRYGVGQRKTAGSGYQPTSSALLRWYRRAILRVLPTASSQSGDDSLRCSWFRSDPSASCTAQQNRHQKTESTCCHPTGLQRRVGWICGTRNWDNESESRHATTIRFLPARAKCSARPAVGPGSVRHRLRRAASERSPFQLPARYRWSSPPLSQANGRSTGLECRLRKDGLCPRRKGRIVGDAAVTAIVGRKDDERAVGKLEAIKFHQHAADRRVHGLNHRSVPRVIETPVPCGARTFLIKRRVLPSANGRCSSIRRSKMVGHLVG